MTTNVEYMECFRTLLLFLFNQKPVVTNRHLYKTGNREIFDSHGGIIQTEKDVYMCIQFMKVLHLSRKRSVLRQDYEVKVI